MAKQNEGGIGAETAAAEGDAERAASLLEQHPDYRVLRRLPEQPGSEGAGEQVRTGLYVDVETTGFDAASDRVIELAMVLFGYDAQGRVTGVLDRFDQLEDPGRPIPPEVVALTGIQDADVRGHAIDDEAALAMLARANLVVAHNAGFDRAFLERRLPAFQEVPWACSQNDVPWREEGFESRKLEWLAFRYGVFYDAHRAVTDCVAGVHLLAQALPASGRIAMEALLESARTPWVAFRAVGAPFETKDLLKARGYRWWPERKVWMKQVAGSDAAAERRWLQEQVYGGRGAPEERSLDAYLRYSPRAFA